MNIAESIRSPLGIQIHFHRGVHVIFPPGTRKFHLRVTSLANGESVFDGEIQSLPNCPVEFKSVQTFYVPWEIEIIQTGHRIYLGKLNLTGREAAFEVTGGTDAEFNAWLPKALNFQQQCNCRLTVISAHPDVDVAPGIRFIRPEEFEAGDYFAVYPVDLGETMKYQPLVSVLIPVYNTEKRLSATLDSVLAQSYQNWELVAYDDGSTDLSGSILEEYAAKEPRLRLLRNQDNRGTIIARKRLALAANGEYSTWVDSDDLIAPDFLEKAVAELQHKRYDIVELPYEVVWGDGSKNQIAPPAFEVEDEQLAEFFFARRRPHAWYLWGKLIRTAALQKTLPPDSRHVLDDVFFILPIFYHAQSYRFAAATHALYTYHCGEGSWSGSGRNMTMEKFSARCKMRHAEIVYNSEFIRTCHLPERLIGSLVEMCDLPELPEIMRRFPVAKQPEAIAVFLNYFCQNDTLVNDFTTALSGNDLRKQLKKLPGYPAFIKHKNEKK